MSHHTSRMSSSELLLNSIRANRNVEQLLAVLDNGDFDWPRFWDLAGQQHVQPLVARSLASGPARPGLRREIIADLDRVRLETVVQNLAARSELNEIITCLQREQIRAIPLKGVDLAERLFGGLDARRCGDIDVLVQDRDWAPARRALARLGYNPISSPTPGVAGHRFHDTPLARVVNGRAFVVELHHRLTDPRFATIDHDALWRRARSRGDGGMPAMPIEELLVFLALHVAKHDTGLLRLFADIDHLTVVYGQELDWEQILKIAREWRVETVLYFTLQRSSALLGTPVPETILRDLRSPWWKRKLVAALAGPAVILRPPGSTTRRAIRFRIAYCLMLAPLTTSIRAYWHYILAPPGCRPRRATLELLWQVLGGSARTALALGGASSYAFRHVVRRSSR